MVAFLGMGLLGSNFVKAMRRRGLDVQVWNRTYSRAQALEADGAKAFEQAADAVKGADHVHLTVSDDAAVDAVLEQARPGLKAGAIIIDHTTTTRQGAIERTRRWKEAGFTYVHAPVFMGPPNALDGSGYMLISGDQDVVSKVEPLLTPMTGKLLNLGADTGKAAGLKLMGNSFLLFLTAGLSDTLSLAKSMGIGAADLSMLFDTWNPGAMAPARLKRIMAADFDNPSWELNMARKDARLMMEEAANGGRELAFVPAIAKEMDRWIDSGNGNKDWTVIAKDNL